jgi:transposase InsO family protein
MTSKYYYDPARPSAYSTLEKLVAAVKKKSADDVRAWLERQDAYTLHRRVVRRFPRNPYSVNNMMDVWECDLVDVQALSKHNDYFKYILSVIDVFSKFLYMIPLQSKTGTAVTAAFQSILPPRPVWVRTDRGKEFINEKFQAMLRREGIQFQVCRNPDVKCSVVERVHRTIKNKMYKYFTYKNTYRYKDVLPKFVRAYNATVHSSTGMAPTRVSDRDVLAIWRRMNEKQRRTVKAKFSVGQHVRVSKEKMKFAKGYEQNFSTEIFRIAKVIERRPRHLYELEDLHETPIEGQFYQEELSPVRISKRTVYKIDKILGNRVRRGITEYPVRWRGYSKDFDSWIPESSVRHV